MSDDRSLMSMIRTSLAEALDSAAKCGITVLSMKRDWKLVFGGT